SGGGVVEVGVRGWRELGLSKAAGPTQPLAVYKPALERETACALPFRYYGGLICYGPDTVSQFRSAAGYVDRILKGEKPVDLPVQAPNKYELVINLKAAKALGLEIPSTCSPAPTR